MADATGLGYEGGAVVFSVALAVVVAAYYWTKVSRVTLFWAAFILTRPLGATVGEFLDKPVSHGGLALSRPIAFAVLAAFIIGCVLLLPQRLRHIRRRLNRWRDKIRGVLLRPMSLMGPDFVKTRD